MVAMRVVHRNSSGDGQVPKTSSNHLHGPVVEEIQGLIKVYKDGHVERPPIVPCVSPSTSSTLHVSSQDVIIDRLTNVWARLYVPNNNNHHHHHHQIKLLPLLLYFHGGGFCVGSAAWSCYHEFLSNLAAKASCLILSVNYRLAPENPLPAAYDDGVRALTWVGQEAAAAGSTSSSSCDRNWARKYCDFGNIFLGGDSAGANIAYNVGLRIRSSSSCFSSTTTTPSSLLTNFTTTIRGTILIQPFFGGDARTASEKSTCPHSSALTLAVSDTYWRLSLPDGATRDHPWSNPSTELLRRRLLDNININNITSNATTMVCIADKDILKDRNLEFCDALERAGKRVERQLYYGVGHAFHVLDKTHISTTRTTQLTSHISSFIASQRTLAS